MDPGDVVDLVDVGAAFAHAIATGEAPAVFKAALVDALLAISVDAGMALGSAHYRRGGRKPVWFPRPERHQMIEDLRLDECCTPAPERTWKAKQFYFYLRYMAPYALPDPR